MTAGSRNHGRSRRLTRRASADHLLLVALAAGVLAAALGAAARVASGAQSPSGVAVLTPRAIPANGGEGAAGNGAYVTINARSVQERLVYLHYLPAAAITGRWDYRTSQAVMAFQAWQGLVRDGTVGPNTLAALAAAHVPAAAQWHRGRSIEVFRNKGVTLLVDGARVVLAVHSSSGRPGYDTPTGVFSIFRKERRSWSYPYKTWLLYASYFNGGIAFHAYPDVPAYPDSHGCIRISAPEARFVYEFAILGTPVIVY